MKKNRSMLRFSKNRLLVFALVFAVIGGFLIWRSFAATSYYVSTSGSDGNGCSQSAPCATFARACSVAQGGDTIQVSAGTYPGQTILRTNCNPSGTVTFLGSGGVTLNGDIKLGANSGSLNGDAPNNLTFDGINIHGYFRTYYNTTAAQAAGPKNITIQNLKIYCTTCGTGGLIEANSLDTFTVRNVEIGPGCCDVDMVQMFMPRQGAPNLKNVHFDKVYIHDGYDTCNNVPSSIKSSLGCSGIGDGDNPGCCQHVDGIQAFGCENCVFENMRIYAGNPKTGGSWGNGQAIFFQPANQSSSGGWFQNLTFQNNMVTCWCGTNTFSLSAPGVSVVRGYAKFLYNTVTGNGIIIYDTVPGNRVLAPGTQVVYAGNVFSGLTHDNGTYNCNFTAGDGSTITPTYAKNLRANGQCGSDIIGTASFNSLNAYSPDLHLSGSQTAIDGGEGTYCPPTDIDGQSRPAGSACDIGADESGGSTQPPANSPTVSLSAAPASINSGASSVLTWSSTNASSCSASGGWSGALATSGSQSTGVLSQSTTYTIVCTGPGGTSQPSSATVTVSLPSPGTPTITNFSPLSGPVGTQVTVNGTNLDQTNILEFNQGDVVSYVINSPSQIVATVPPNSQTGNFSINYGQATSPQPFTVTTGQQTDLTPPNVSIASPTNGATVSGSAVSVSANATDNVGVAKVVFYYDSTVIITDTTAPYNATWDSTLVLNGSHSIVAKAYDAAGNNATSTVVVNVSNGDTTPPSTPTNVKATANGSNRVDLTWTASTDNVGVAGYYVVRNGTTIAQTTGTSYSDNSVNASTTYTYQLIAFDARGNNSGLSTGSTVTTPAAAGDTTPPSHPGTPTAVAVSSSQINLSWGASTDNVGVTAYDVYRNSTKIATVATTSFGDTGLAANTTFSYYIVARDAAGNSSPPSSTASATTQAVQAQYGALTGTVRASNGSVLRGVKVSITVNGSTTTTSTASDGTYHLLNIPQGSFKVTYSLKHYTTQTVYVAINVGQTSTVNITLQHR